MTKICFDSSCLRILLQDTDAQTVFFRSVIVPRKDSNPSLSFSWPALLEYVDLGRLFDDFPVFTPQTPLFSTVLAAINHQAPDDILFALFDRVFVECLTLVKALPFMHADKLYKRFGDAQQKCEGVLASFYWDGLEEVKKKWEADAAFQMHDLTLFLAWDRVCCYMRSIFDYHAEDLLYPASLDIFKSCLVESFQHITLQGKSSPSYFKLVEALYAYFMRDEKIQLYSEKEWLVLCKAANILQPTDALADIPYVDRAIELDSMRMNEGHIVTAQNSMQIEAGLSFAAFVADKIQDKKWAFSPHKLLISSF